ncbi:APC family permease [Corynebacterium argentoratense]|uniref:APC family permease n=1 Tax=Corynebacterium argentoratense TaxID=42817 RepID=UPI00248DFCA7|nr:APC family permease [Corynebacterium argentoratense]
MENNRRLRTHHIVFLVLAAAAPLTVVSSGITAAYSSSGMAGVPLGYILSGALVATFALGFCAMAREIPNTAAFFSYASAGLGRSHGLAASWLAIVSYCAMQIALYSLLGYTANALIMSVTGASIPWWVCSLVALALVGALGLNAADATSKILGIVLTFELITVAIYCITVLKNPANGLNSNSITPSTFWGEGTGTLLAFTIAGFMGIESSTMYAEEAKTPEKTIPRATLIAILSITVFYGFASWAIAQSVGENAVVSEARSQSSDLFFNFLADHGHAPLVPFIRFLLITSLFAAVTAYHNSIARYIMALGREEVIWKHLGQTSLAGVPVAASVALSMFGFLAIAGGALAQRLLNAGNDFPASIIFAWMSNAGGFGLVFLFMITGLSIYRYFKKNPDRYSIFVTKFTPLLATAGFAVVFVLILTNFNNLIGDAELWYLVFIIPGVILSCGIAGYARGEYLRLLRPWIYQNIGSGHSPEPSASKR